MISNTIWYLLVLAVFHQSSGELCFDAFESSGCSDIPIPQGIVNRTQPPDVEGCNAGAYGNLRTCNPKSACELVSKNIPSQCSKDTCMNDSCILYRHCLGCQERKFGIYGVDSDSPSRFKHSSDDITSLVSATSRCTHFGMAGNGWGAPSVGTVSELPSHPAHCLYPSGIHLQLGKLYLVDAVFFVLPNGTGYWVQPSTGSQINISRWDSEWAPGTDKNFENGTHLTLSVVVNEEYIKIHGSDWSSDSEGSSSFADADSSVSGSGDSSSSAHAGSSMSGSSASRADSSVSGSGDSSSSHADSSVSGSSSSYAGSSMSGSSSSHADSSVSGSGYSSSSSHADGSSVSGSSSSYAGSSRSGSSSSHADSSVSGSGDSSSSVHAGSSMSGSDYSSSSSASHADSSSVSGSSSSYAGSSRSGSSASHADSSSVSGSSSSYAGSSMSGSSASHADSGVSGSDYSSSSSASHADSSSVSGSSSSYAGGSRSGSSASRADSSESGSDSSSAAHTDSSVSGSDSAYNDSSASNGDYNDALRNVLSLGVAPANYSTPSPTRPPSKYVFVLTAIKDLKQQPVNALCNVEQETSETPSPTYSPSECHLLEEEAGLKFKKCETSECNGEFADLQSATEYCCSLDELCKAVLYLDAYTIGIGNALSSASNTGSTFPRNKYVAPTVYSGISITFIVILTLVVVFTFYCAIGMVLKVQQGEATCPEVLPNHIFWSTLPSNIAKCCSVMCYKMAEGSGYRAVNHFDDEMEGEYNDPIEAT